MMGLWVLLITPILFLLSCSHKIYEGDVEESINISKPGTPKSRVRAALGEPVKVISSYAEVYMACDAGKSTEKSRSNRRWALLTLGISEAVNMPMAFIKGCPKTPMVFVFDELDRVVAVVEPRVYEYATELYEVSVSLSDKEGYKFIAYDKGSGWWYILPESTKCRLEYGRMTIYGVYVPNIKRAAQMIKDMRLKEPPYYVLWTIEFNANSEKYRITKYTVHGNEKTLFDSQPQEKWKGLHPAEAIYDLYVATAAYCVQGMLKEQDKQRKPDKPEEFLL